MSPPGRAERTEQDAPPCRITFRRLTLRSATGTLQRGGPYHPGQTLISEFGFNLT